MNDYIDFSGRKEGVHDTIISNINYVISGKGNPSEKVDKIFVKLLDVSIGYKTKSNFFE